MDPDQIWDFNPEGVTTVHDLVDADKDTDVATTAAAAMEAAIHTFRSCFLDDLRAASKQALLAKARAAAPETLAW